MIELKYKVRKCWKDYDWNEVAKTCWTAQIKDMVGRNWENYEDTNESSWYPEIDLKMRILQ
jgi:hypothetical protein